MGNGSKGDRKCGPLAQSSTHYKIEMQGLSLSPDGAHKLVNLNCRLGVGVGILGLSSAFSVLCSYCSSFCQPASGIDMLKRAP